MSIKLQKSVAKALVLDSSLAKDEKILLLDIIKEEDDLEILGSFLAEVGVIGSADDLEIVGMLAESLKPVEEGEGTKFWEEKNKEDKKPEEEKKEEEKKEDEKPAEEENEVKEGLAGAVVGGAIGSGLGPAGTAGGAALGHMAQQKIMGKREGTEVIEEKRKMSPAQKAALAKGREALSASGKNPIKKKSEEKPEEKKDKIKESVTTEAFYTKAAQAILKQAGGLTARASKLLSQAKTLTGSAKAAALRQAAALNARAAKMKHAVTVAANLASRNKLPSKVAKKAAKIGAVAGAGGAAGYAIGKKKTQKESADQIIDKYLSLVETTEKKVN